MRRKEEGGPVVLATTKPLLVLQHFDTGLDEVVRFARTCSTQIYPFKLMVVAR
jgi:hypothetical protein